MEQTELPKQQTNKTERQKLFQTALNTYVETTRWFSSLTNSTFWESILSFYSTFVILKALLFIGKPAVKGML